MRQSYSRWLARVERELDRLDTHISLVNDELMNAQEAYEKESMTAKEFASQVADRRDWAIAKATGDLWR